VHNLRSIFGDFGDFDDFWQNNNNFTLNRHTMLLHHRPFWYNRTQSGSGERVHRDLGSVSAHNLRSVFDDFDDFDDFWQNNNNFTLNRHTMLLHHRPFWYNRTQSGSGDREA